MICKKLKTMPPIKLALDWTPNINHIGFFIAQQKGYYEEAGITLELLNPLVDDYRLTPGKKVMLGLADMAIAPFETIISLNNKPEPFDAIAIYAILQQDLSSIVTLKSSGITRPSQLDQHSYASYKARYEDAIVKEMVKNDGGQGDILCTYPAKLGIWNTLLLGEATATWIFDNWEGTEATFKGIALNHFRLADYGIPYGYSPIVLASRSQIQQKRDAYTAFIHATQKGYQFATENPTESIAILSRYLTEEDRNSRSLEESLRLTAPHFGNETQVGYMDENRVTEFLQWLVQHHLEKSSILTQKLYTNELLG